MVGPSNTTYVAADGGDVTVAAAAVAVVTDADVDAAGQVLLIPE